MKYLRFPDDGAFQITLPIGIERAESTVRRLFPELLERIARVEDEWDRFDALAGLYKSLRSHLDYLDELDDLKARKAQEKAFYTRGG